MGSCLSSYQNTSSSSPYRFRYGMFGRITPSRDSVSQGTCMCDACLVYRPSVDSELTARQGTKKILKKYTDTPRPDVIN